MQPQSNLATALLGIEDGRLTSVDCLTGTRRVRECISALVQNVSGAATSGPQGSRESEAVRPLASIARTPSAKDRGIASVDSRDRLT